MPLFLVMIGSALGGGLRYILADMVIGQSEPGKFPIGILLVNLTGCFFFGLLSGLTPNPNTKLFLGTGVAGGFTTYSAYNAQAIALGSSQPYIAILYVTATLSGCIFSHLIGSWATQAGGKPIVD